MPKTTQQHHHRPQVGTQKLSTDNVRLYLRDIGRVPLLSPAQELELGRQIQAMMSLLALKEQLIQRDEDEPSLQVWAQAAQIEVTELKSQLKQGQKAKQQMITANLRLVVMIAKKYTDRNLEFLDLIQEGTLGLQRGVEKFDPQKGYRFSTYAYWWIRQGITRAIAEQGRTIRIPIHVTEKLNKIKRTQRDLSQSLGRTPTTAEVGQALSLSTEQIREYFSLTQHTLSLDLRVGDDQDKTMTDFLEAEDPLPEEVATQQALQQSIQQLVATLPTPQQEILRLRYGLDDGKGLTLAAISRQMGISRERVRQIQQKALQHLRQQKDSVQDYFAN